MSDRFYADCNLQESTVALDAAESHHLVHVMRKSVGDRIVVFNGRGREATAEVSEMGQRNATAILCKVVEAPPPAPKITLAVAIPKGDRFRWLVEKAAELGVNRLVPLLTDRSVVSPGSTKLDKAKRWAIEAAKQSRSQWLLQCEPPLRWDEFWKSLDGNSAVLIAQPGGTLLRAVIAEIAVEREITGIIGPEGGFTETEVQTAMTAGALPVDLSRNILRVETAAIALASCLRLMIG